MNKQTRKRYADKVRAIVEAAGAVVAECDDEPAYQETRVEIHFPDVRLSFDIGDRVQTAVVCSWYRAERDLKHCGTFSSINEFHKRKATTVRRDAEALIDWLPGACAAAMGGSIFA